MLAYLSSVGWPRKGLWDGSWAGADVARTYSEFGGSWLGRGPLVALVGAGAGAKARTTRLPPVWVASNALAHVAKSQRTWSRRLCVGHLSSRIARRPARYYAMWPTSCARNGRGSRRSSRKARSTCCRIWTSPSSTAASCIARMRSTRPSFKQIPVFLFGWEAPFFCPGQISDRAARSSGQGWPQGHRAAARHAPLTAASKARPSARPGVIVAKGTRELCTRARCGDSIGLHG
jgi:hypothetical protein